MEIKILGALAEEKSFNQLTQTGDGLFQIGKDGVKQILEPKDGKTEFVFFETKTLARVKSALGYPAYYPVHKTEISYPIQAVLMDLDGTSVRSEDFWIWIIEKTTGDLLENPSFSLKSDDIPFVSGHSVSEHLQYCIKKYCPEKSLEKAREFYFKNTHYEMNEIMEGRGKSNAFHPVPGLKKFLCELKKRKIKIGLVTSGLHEKAWPEILSAFRTLEMGNPEDFYDSIITAGFPLRKGAAGTLGELSPKPHPWLYAETCRVGLGIPFEKRNSVIGIEDSSAGVTSIRLAGFNVIGISGGNIIESGSLSLCDHYCDHFEEILKIIDREGME